MSWIKIEFQKGKACKTPKNQVEHIDYEKIREITHEVVKEELKAQQNNQPTPLTKADIQEAVCQAIIQADEKRDEIEKVRKSKKRPNRFRAAAMAAANMLIPVLLAFLVLLAGIWMWVEYTISPAHTLLEYIAYSLMYLCIIVASICCSIEAWKDDDENAIKHFNTNVALVALVVAFVALVKG